MILSSCKTIEHLPTAWSTTGLSDKGTSQAGRLLVLGVDMLGVRPLGPVMLNDVKAALEILGLATHVPSIWKRDIHICLHIARGRE